MFKKFSPKVIRPFAPDTFARIQEHVLHVRDCFDWPGIPYHDRGGPRFNRWVWHNLPRLAVEHRDAKFVAAASDWFGLPVKPSYVFLSMYGPDGVCPLHSDRPECQFTVDLVIEQDNVWPLYIEDVPYSLEVGEAVCYSGTGNPHYRKPMNEDSKATRCTLAFFHFVPANWMGKFD